MSAVTQIFAHRGLHQVETENTVGAFAEARAAGADGVELDVRRTRDGALVVLHDPLVEGVGAVADLECRQLPATVATLEEALTTCAGLRVNVEIKNHPSEAVYDASGALAHQVVTTLGELGWLDDVIISCFDLATCEAVRLAHASVPVGWLLDWRLDASGSVDQVVERGLSAIHPFFSRVDESLVDRAHARGIEVNVWTVNAAEEMARQFRLGVDAVITDDPRLARATLAAQSDVS
jgi:glycerophosphoryl diester phosphodiesterase